MTGFLLAIGLTIVIIVFALYINSRSHIKRTSSIRTSDTESQNSKRILYQKVIDRNNPLEFDIAGIYYRSSEVHKLARKLNPGTLLDFELESDNEYDEYAIKIMYKNIHLGYVPAYYSESIFEPLSNGGKCVIEVMRNNRGEKPHVWVKLYPIG